MRSAWFRATEVPSVTSATPQTRGYLFADLRGYSRFTEEHGDHAAAELIRRYRDLLRAEIAAFHGAEIRTEGDSFYVVFGSVSEAVQAGIAIRDRAAQSSADATEAPINVGIGIHAGEATDGDLGIVSSAVNIAARLCAVAEPGEVLVTDTVRSLTRGFLAVEFSPRRPAAPQGHPRAARSVPCRTRRHRDPGRVASLGRATCRNPRVVRRRSRGHRGGGAHDG
jgi:class 3 adenylate cyclase